MTPQGETGHNELWVLDEAPWNLSNKCFFIISLSWLRKSILKVEIIRKQAQRRAAAGRSRHKSHWVIQY